MYASKHLSYELFGFRRRVTQSVDVVEPSGSQLNTTVEQEVRDHGWRGGGYVVA